MKRSSPATEKMLQNDDGKFRYIKTIRREMFLAIKEKILSVDPKLFLYLCMETKSMWNYVFDYVPSSSKNLNASFEKRRLYMESLATI